jgi:hypothetical protein
VPRRAAADLRPAADKLGITLADGLHYARALARWTAAGFPERSQANVERILPICQACNWYAAGRCTKCRCRVNSGPAAINKIRMATEDCPLGKWTSISEHPTGDS